VVRGRVRATKIAPPVAAAPRAWIDGAQLLRATPFGPEPIGQILPGATKIWCGASIGPFAPGAPDSLVAGPAPAHSMGLGLWRAGGYTQVFAFRTDRRGLRDGIAIPRIRGALLDAHAVCAADRGWLWWRESLAGREITRCAAISATGDVLAIAEDEAWLDGVRGACAIGAVLFVPTDGGIVRIEVVNGALAQTRHFPDTSDFVTSADALTPAPGGLDVRTRDGALRLTLS
jgi:hypothetical protein